MALSIALIALIAFSLAFWWFLRHPNKESRHSSGASGGTGMPNYGWGNGDSGESRGESCSNGGNGGDSGSCSSGD